MNLFENEFNHNLLPFDGEVYLFGFVFSSNQANSFFEQLLTSIEWKPDTLVMFGKEISTKRKVAWYGDKASVYTYSNSTKSPLPWNPILLEIKKMIEDKTGEQFNACLLNLYHDGTEGMGWHSDDEKELGPEPVIASLSLGATRNFVFKHRKTKQKQGINLESGMLLIMKGRTQQHWQHSLLKATRVKSPRINLTFRTIY